MRLRIEFFICWLLFFRISYVIQYIIACISFYLYDFVSQRKLVQGQTEELELKIKSASPCPLLRCLRDTKKKKLRRASTERSVSKSADVSRDDNKSGDDIKSRDDNKSGDDNKPNSDTVKDFFFIKKKTAGRDR